MRQAPRVSSRPAGACITQSSHRLSITSRFSCQILSARIRRRGAGRMIRPHPLYERLWADRQTGNNDLVSRSLFFSFAHPDDELLRRRPGDAMPGAGNSGCPQSQQLSGRWQTATLVSLREDLASCRKAELQRVARIVSIATCTYSTTANVELADAKPDEIQALVVALIRRHRPTVVLTFDPNGFNMHPDHVAIAGTRWMPSQRQETGVGSPRLATRTPARVLWTSPNRTVGGRTSNRISSQSLAWSSWCDVSAWTNRKAAALKAHRSQQSQSTDASSASRTWIGSLRRRGVSSARGPDLTRRAADDVFEGDRRGLIETRGSGRRPSPYCVVCRRMRRSGSSDAVCASMRPRG